MAAIRTREGFLAITSGNSIAVINTRNPTVCHIVSLPCIDGNKPEKKDEVESLLSAGAGNGSVNRALASGFSASGRYFAVCDDFKVLHVYVTGTDSWTLLNSRMLTRRATSLTFTLDESIILVADKAGDVYSFPTAAGDKDSDEPHARSEGKLLLGHLSMVLDLCLADGDKYVATCDRDEKIRLSHYPNAYNIHTYCLGHTEFVTCLIYVEEFRALVSGSGDCTLRVWNMEGKQLCQVQCPVNRRQPAVTAQQTSAQRERHGGGSGHDGGEKTNKEKGETTREEGKPAIRGLTYCRQCRLLIASFYGLPELQVYQLKVTENRTWLTFWQTVQLQADVWDVTFDDTNKTLWVLSPLEGSTLLAYQLSSNCHSDAGVSQVDDENGKVSEVAKKLNSVWSFFTDSLTVASVIPSLWKTCSQVYVTDYQQRKQQRLQGLHKGSATQRAPNNRQKAKENQPSPSSSTVTEQSEGIPVKRLKEL